jgi:hypothetical protein
VVLNAAAGIAPDASGPYLNRRYMVAGTVLSKRPDNTYERFTNLGTGGTPTAAINETQTVTMVGPPTGGTWRVAFQGATTADLAYNISAANLQTALVGLSTIGAGNAAVTGSAGGPYTVTFQGALAGSDVPLLAVDASSLQGAGNQDVVVQSGTEGRPSEVQNVAGILFDTVEFADGSELSDEPVAMLRRHVSFQASKIVDFALYQTQILAGLPTCEFV